MCTSQFNVLQHHITTYNDIQLHVTSYNNTYASNKMGGGFLTILGTSYLIRDVSILFWKHHLSSVSRCGHYCYSPYAGFQNHLGPKVWRFLGQNVALRATGRLDILNILHFVAELRHHVMYSIKFCPFGTWLRCSIGAQVSVESPRELDSWELRGGVFSQEIPEASRRPKSFCIGSCRLSAE